MEFLSTLIRNVLCVICCAFQKRSNVLCSCATNPKHYFIATARFCLSDIQNILWSELTEEEVSYQNMQTQTKNKEKTI